MPSSINIVPRASLGILCAITLLIPIAVLPYKLQNIFFTPKLLVLLVGACLLAGIYAVRYIGGRPVLTSRSSAPKLLVLLIVLNFLSFFYTENIYYTRVAALMNISCLLFFYFASIFIDRRWAIWFFGTIAFSGFLVALITYLQFSGQVILFKGLKSGNMVTGTIGNPNYLGAYLLFPLLALSGLVVVADQKWRPVFITFFIFVFGALLFSRGRAAWVGFGLSFPVFLMLVRKIYDFSFQEYFNSHKKQVVIYGIAALMLVSLLWMIAPQRFHGMMKVKNLIYTGTLAHRMKFYRASWHMFKKAPLFGNGLWSFRNQVYDAQAEINRSDPTYFKDYPQPKPRRVHNEYLEILNDGGLVAAALLLLFFMIVMTHGWQMIQDEAISRPERIFSATAFSTLVGIMIISVFFFPLRINSTLVMAALMLAIMEAVYLRNRGLLVETQGQCWPFTYLLIPVLVLLLASVVWFRGYRPFRAELEHFKFKTAMAKKNAPLAEKYILKTISFDPDSTIYNLDAGRLYLEILRDYVKSGDFIERAIIKFNGDIAKWAVYHGKGEVKYRLGSLFEAREAYKTALYYNPTFLPSQTMLAKVEKVFQEEDTITLKLK